MKKVRQVVAYGDYFQNFLVKQTQKVQDKIYKIIEIIEIYERVPSKYLKALKGTDGLYEARIKLGKDIWRVFCFFDEGRFVVLLTGFHKKTQRTPKRELDRAIKLRDNYFIEKNVK